MLNINIKQTTEALIQSIKDYFKNNGPHANAIIGSSGGKDSLVAAALCKEALGADRVIGVMMPEFIQKDIADSQRTVQYLGIRHLTVDIGLAVKDLYTSIKKSYNFQKDCEKIDGVVTNTPARMRMVALYAIGAMENGRVICTSNASEAYVGYSTKWGDGVGDFAPLRNLTTEEVCAIGIELGLPKDLVYKTPSDGMSGLSDEDKLGFNYKDVNIILRDGNVEMIEPSAYAKINYRHNIAMHKLKPMPMFNPLLTKGD